MQSVAQSTHKDKIIDVIITNCSQYYAVPEVTSPILPDDPRHAAPSDHRVPVAHPLASSARPQSNSYSERTCRPMPDSAVRTFMHWIHTEKWDSVPKNGSTTAQVTALEKLINEKVNTFFPEKKIRFTNIDKPFITAELKTLDRKKKREWKKRGRSNLYLQLKSEFQEKFKKAASTYLKKCVSDLKTAEPGKAAATLKRMGAQPGDYSNSGSFTLLNHVRENLSVEEQLARFSDYFVAVSHEFPALQLNQLSPNTLHKLANIKQEEIPIVEDYEIFQILDRCKKKKSSVPGDMPPKLFYAASAGLAEPAAIIKDLLSGTKSWFCTTSNHY